MPLDGNKIFPRILFSANSEARILAPVYHLLFVARGGGREQGGITCGAIDEPRKSSKAIDERVIINFRDKNVVIARFRNKNEALILFL